MEIPAWLLFIFYVLGYFFFLIFFLAFQVKLGELEAELVEINANNDKLQRSYNELMEYKLVLEKVYVFSIFLIQGFVDVSCIKQRSSMFFLCLNCSYWFLNLYFP